VRLSLDEADLTNVTPESRASALEQFKKYETGFIYTPPSVQGTITTPSHQGGVEWGGASFDPYSNVLYVNANEAPSINTLRRFYDLDKTTTPVELGAMIYQKNCTSCHGLERQGIPPVYPALTSIKKNDEAVKVILRQGSGIMPAFTGFTDKELNAMVAYLRSDPTDSQAETTSSRIRYSVQIPFFLDPNGVPAIAPPWGTLNAINLNTGSILWKVPLGEYPELVERGIRHTGAKNFGGPVATAGGVVFIAATPDEKIRAFDTHSGAVLWDHKLPAGGYATPSIYVIDGKQYVVIAAGGGGKNGTKYGDSMVAFALPSEDTQSDKVKSAGWLDLFDGLTLNGWVHLNGSHSYTVEEGAIVGRTVAGSLNSFLCTEQEFGDFELELEVMVDSITNSGIQIRSRARPFTNGEGHDLRAGRVNGPQVEMQRNHRPGTPTTGLIYGEALGTGWLSSDEKIQNGHHHLYNEGWNKMRIVAKGPRIQTWVNSHPVEDLVNEEVYKTHASGFIGLQIHGMDSGELFTMKWKNIRIRTLTKD
jgi:quinoprotein glucose dehydrogenase